MERFEKYVTVIQQAIDQIEFPKEPAGLYDSINYFLHIGGKRIRPLLTLITAEMFCGEINKNAINAAIGIELFHNFTLLHDDIMDHAPLRRNAQTVHMRWNENTAILSGDVLYTLAVENFIASNNMKANQLFLRTAREVCEGQQYDMLFENSDDVTIDNYIEMIRLKTSVLIGCALKAGAILGGASEEDQELCYDLGINIGLAFQLQDDHLDTFGTNPKIGKRIGGDILENKKTFLYLKAWELASNNQKETIKSLLTEQDEVEKINGFMEIFNTLGIQEKSDNIIAYYFDKGVKNLNELSIPEANKEVLSQVIHYLYHRNH